MERTTLEIIKESIRDGKDGMYEISDDNRLSFYWEVYPNNLVEIQAFRSYGDNERLVSITIPETEVSQKDLDYLQEKGIEILENKERLSDTVVHKIVEAILEIKQDLKLDCEIEMSDVVLEVYNYIEELLLYGEYEIDEWYSW